MTIYAAFNADGDCLYVGRVAGRHPALRWAEHVRSGADWAQAASRWEVLTDLTEAAATVRLSPLHSALRHASKTVEPEAEVVNGHHAESAWIPVLGVTQELALQVALLSDHLDELQEDYFWLQVNVLAIGEKLGLDLG